LDALVLSRVQALITRGSQALGIPTGRSDANVVARGLVQVLMEVHECIEHEFKQVPDLDIRDAVQNSVVLQNYEHLPDGPVEVRPVLGSLLS
jgi:hypothetical protein